MKTKDKLLLGFLMKSNKNLLNLKTHNYEDQTGIVYS